MRKILVAVDHGTLAEKIIVNAENLRRSINGECAIISVTDVTIDLSESGYTPIELVRLDKEERKRFIHHLLEENNIECGQLFFESGKPKQIILDVAYNWGADILVIGTHGRKGIEHLLMGSCAEYIIRHSEIPVLVITSKHK
ncbi:MAG: universal stress protein [Bacteroidia bacterium]